VLRGWREIGAAFDEALTVVDMVTFLGADEADMRSAAQWARTTLTRLGAQPFLDRMDAGLANKDKRAPARSTTSSRAPSETPAG
jgi:hypothetical protein